MQQPDLEACVVRVCDRQGGTRGTGFVVTGGLVVTCAHVVKACGVASGGCVRVEFHVSGEARQAEVLPDSWRSPEADDAAILHLLPPDKALPDGVVPVMLGSAHHCHGHRMRALGFPSLPCGYDVAWAKGKIRGEVPHPAKLPMLQLDARPICRGMSGAPVLDLDTGRVVGVVNEYLKSIPLEWATTSDTLHTICSDLPLHLPQVVEEYLTAVAQFCRDLPYVSLRSDVPLEVVYVRQQTRPQPADMRDEKNIRHILAEQVRAMSIIEALEHHPRIVVIGGPGAGKSTLLRHLVQQSVTGDGQGCSTIPILVSLRGLAERKGDLATRLREEIAAELGARLPRPLPENFLAEWAEQTGAAWLIALDGLDEIVDAGRRRELVRELAQAAWPSQACVLVTTRPDAATALPKGFTSFGLLPFERGQAEEFARRWFRDDEQRPQVFLGALESARLSELSGIPLLLTVAATVFEEATKKPGFSEKPGFFAGFRRSRLYDEFVRILLDEDAAPGRRMHAQFRGQFGADLGEALFRHRRRILEWIALALQEERDVRVVLAERLRQPPFSRSDLDSDQDVSGVLEILACKRAGLVTQRGDAYVFVHPTFREYLAAASVLRECGQDLEQVWQKAVSHWKEWNWREAALFALNLLSDEGKDVTTLVEHIWQAGENGLYFAGMALAERVGVETNLSDEIMDDLIAAARMMSFLDQWSDSNPLIILGELRGYPRVANSFLGLARDEQVWIGVRKGATEALDQLGRVDDLLALVHDEQVDEQIRERAAAALGRLGWVDEAAPILLALACDEYADAQVRKDAAATLGELGQADEATPILLALARGKEDGWVREQATEALGRLGRADDLLALACDEQVDEWVRERAAEALGQLGWGDEAAPILLALARDEKVLWSEREQAVVALGRLGQADEVGSVLSALVRDEKADRWERGRATEVLGKLRRADDLLVLACDEQMDEWVREEAAEMLGELGRAEGLLMLARNEQVVSERVRERAAEILGELGWIEEATSCLLALARNAQVDEWVRKDAAEALGKMGQADEAISILLVLARDKKMKAEVRLASAGILGRLGHVEEAAPVLATLAHDEKIEGWIREDTAEALCELGCVEEAIPILQVLAYNEQMGEWVRRAAAEMLGRLGHVKEAISILLALAHDEKGEEGVRKDAAEALCELGRGEEATPILLALACDNQVDGGVRKNAAEVLGRLGRIDEAAQAWLALVCDEQLDEWAREQAATTLSQLGRADEAAQAWLALARDEKMGWWIRERAAEALGGLRQIDRAACILLALARDAQADDWGRKQSAAALGRLGWTDESTSILLSLVHDMQVNRWVRRDAMAALEQFANARVLPELERMAQTDVDRKVRQAAQKAIKSIRGREDHTTE